MSGNVFLQVELACNPARLWTGKYVSDFQQLLPGKLLISHAPCSVIFPDPFPKTVMKCFDGRTTGACLQSILLACVKT